VLVTGYVVEALSRAEDVRVRRSALHYLATRQSDQRAYALLVGLLDDPDPFLRSGAVKALARLADPAAVASLSRIAAADKELGIRLQAMTGLATLGDRRAIPLFLGVLFDDEWGRPMARQTWRLSRRLERAWASKQLRKFDGTEALPELKARAQSAGFLERLRLRTLIRALGRSSQG
jgi:HEAT repeat protein